MNLHQKIQIIFCYFLITLYSFYSNTLSIPYASMGGGFCLILLHLIHISQSTSKKLTISKNLFLAVSYILFTSLTHLITSGENLNVTRLFSMGYLLILFSSVKYFSDKLTTEYILRPILIIHLAFIYSQFILNYAFGLTWDPLYFFSGINQSGWGGSLENNIIGHFKRFGGLYNEPGTYATFIAPLIALFGMEKNRSTLDKTIYISGIISLILTFSIFALIFSIIITFWTFRIKSIYLFIATLPITIYFFIPYLEYRFDSNTDYAGTEFRVSTILNFIKLISENPMYLFTGTGVLSISNDPSQFVVTNDIGLFSNLFLSFGLIFILIASLFIILKWKTLDGKSKLCLIVLSLSKISIFAPSFILVLALISSRVCIKKNSTLTS